MERIPLLELNPIVIHDTRLPSSLCDELIHYFDDIPPERGTTRSETKDRKVFLKWCRPGDWVPSFMWNYVSTINETNFQYELSGLYFTEVHFLHYRPGHFYNWHSDDSLRSCYAYAPPKSSGKLMLPTVEYVRKLSFSLQLSTPNEYTGGELQLLHNCDTSEKMMTCPKEKGTLCVFDSRTRHRVLPVKTGIRKVLVGWAVGPRWK